MYELPSKKFNNIWNEGICYSEVNNIITDKKDSVDAFRWVKNVEKNFSDNLKKQKVIIDDNTLEKRCRDLYYLIYGILNQFKNLRNYGHIYNGIKVTVKSHINSAFINLKYANCMMNDTKENYYEQANLKDKKYIDDICEDIKYIDSNISDINSSSKCKEIKEHILEKNSSLRTTYNPESDSDILKYYKFKSLDELDNIIKKIKCTPNGDTEQLELTGGSHEASQLSGHIPIIFIFSFLGFLPMCLFLYKVTPVGTWLKMRIKKKIKLDNNLSDETENEIYEETSECVRNNLHDDKYSILYHSTGYSK
ncbi:PIR Superfamily Protein [Plasmodium ovale wallikeri]|uniref:PIR Superfamily Protein n=1 Tax=Plasmodium ovale wallikeri TaxID=864142 RepID=A0A1A9AKC3_PLAOA|nr:PIR Superfamily Protein [Plasmodium ovale wallikeri]SBT59089.1 PIR Superfamily Protein [Plasmodium ovale wallikeri]